MWYDFSPHYAVWSEFVALVFSTCPPNDDVGMFDVSGCVPESLERVLVQRWQMEWELFAITRSTSSGEVEMGEGAGGHRNGLARERFHRMNISPRIVWC